MGRLTLHNLLRTFGAMMALLTVTDKLCGMRFAKSSCLIGAVCAAAFTALTQFAIAMAFDYIDLADMLFPLYRMEMIMVEEGYLFRMDESLALLLAHGGHNHGGILHLWQRDAVVQVLRPEGHTAGSSGVYGYDRLRGSDAVRRTLR